MELEWIKSMACPECGETRVIEEEIYLDDNYNNPSRRKIWEKRHFACGMYAKNDGYGNDDFGYTCHCSTAYKAFTIKREKLIADVKALLTGQISDALIKDITSQIEWHAIPSHFLDEPAKPKKTHCPASKKVV
jgi:hypothetical protein